MNNKSSKRKGLSIIKKVVLILVLALILSGTFEATAGRPILGYVTEAAQTQTYMAKDEAEFVTILREALVNRERNIKIAISEGTLTQDRVYELLVQAQEHTGNPKEGDYIFCQMDSFLWGVGTEVIDSVSYSCAEYTINYYSTVAQEQEVDTAVAALLSELNLEGLSDYEKIMHIYDHLTPLIEYDNSFIDSSYTAYGAIVNHTAVCQGYSLLFYRLMLELGIDCRIITGKAIDQGEEEPHAWNIVKLGDVYYNVDFTWDSGLATRGRYRCLLENTEDFENHYRDEDYLTDAFQQQYPMAEVSYPIEPEIVVSPEDTVGNYGEHIKLYGAVHIKRDKASVTWESKDAGSEEWVEQPGLSHPDINHNIQFLCGPEDDGDQYRLVIRDKEGNLLKASEPATIYVMPFYEPKEWIWADDYSSADVILKSTVSDNTLLRTCPAYLCVDEPTCYSEGREYYKATVQLSRVHFYSDEIEIRTIPITDHKYFLKKTDHEVENGEARAYFIFGCSWCDLEVPVPAVIEREAITHGSTCGEPTYWTLYCYMDAETSLDHEEHREEIDASYYEPHDYGEPVWSWSDDHAAASATFTCRKNPEHTEEVSSNRIEEETTGATCLSEGQTIYTAYVSFQDKEYSDQKTVTIGKLAHNFGEWEVAQAPSCVEAGLKERVCSICGEKETEVIPATGHTWSEDYTIVMPASCTSAGMEAKYCTVCEIIDGSSTREIPATGHTLYIEESLSKAPTCTEQGKNVYFCKDCKYAREETIAALGHDWGSDGKCTRCGETQGIDGWVQDDDGIWHYYTHGIAATGLTPVGGASYYFDESGNMLTGWISILEPISDYYPGQLVTKWLYAESSGALATGWRSIGGKWYYFGDDYRMYGYGQYEINGKYYYFDYSGQMLTGWIKRSLFLGLEEQIPATYWYYANSSGELQKGWQKIGGVWYYFSPYSCVMEADRCCTIDGKEYFFYESGAMGTGWCKWGSNTWYYANSSGVLQKGWLKIGGVWYYFKHDGTMAAKEWVPGYYWISGSGAWTYQPVGSWKQNSTGRWFGDTSGWYAKNETIIIDGGYYTFNAAGYLVE